MAPVGSIPTRSRQPHRSGVPVPPAGLEPTAAVEGRTPCLNPADAVTTILLVNPTAGHGLAGRLAPATLAAARRAWGDVRQVDTTGPNEAVALVRQAVEAGASRIVTLGGDGTIHEAANGLLTARVDQRPPITVIAAGTGNDLAKLCGTLGLTPAAAIERLAGGSIRRLDVGEAWGEFFLNSVGVGFDAEVAERLKLLKHGRGLAAYLLTVLRTLNDRQPFDAEVEAGSHSFSDRLLLLEVGNGPVVGGGFRITPLAQPDDGLFDVCAIQDMPIPLILSRLPLVMLGRHLGLRQVRHFQCDRLTIRSRTGELMAQMDGEVRRRNEPLEVRLIPAALPILVAT